MCVIVNGNDKNNDIIIPYFEWKSSKKCNSKRFLLWCFRIVRTVTGFLNFVHCLVFRMAHRASETERFSPEV